MYTTVEEANQAFALMVEHATADFDLEASEYFYHYICGASDLLKKIREAAEARENDPKGKYL